jgi:hypothetical protein
MGSACQSSPGGAGPAPLVPAMAATAGWAAGAATGGCAAAAAAAGAVPEPPNGGPRRCGGNGCVEEVPVPRGEGAAAIAAAGVSRIAAGFRREPWLGGRRRRRVWCCRRCHGGGTAPAAVIRCLARRSGSRWRRLGGALLSKSVARNQASGPATVSSRGNRMAVLGPRCRRQQLCPGCCSPGRRISGPGSRCLGPEGSQPEVAFCAILGASARCCRLSCPAPLAAMPST